MVRGASNIARLASRRLLARQWTQPRRAMAQDASRAALASDAFQLLAEENKSAAAEDELFDTHVQAMTQWWRSPRFAGVQRPYTPESVVARRGTLQQTYPSSLMARKLFDLLEAKAKAALPLHIRKASIQPGPAADPHSGRHRPGPNDPASTEPGSAVSVRMGMQLVADDYKRSFGRLWRLPVQHCP